MHTNQLTTLAQLIADDGHACTFQSLGNYRSALLKEIAQASAAPEQEPVAGDPPGSFAKHMEYMERCRQQQKTIDGMNATHWEAVQKLEAATQRADAAERKLGEAVPEGWKLVPIEPTTEMVNAFKERVAVTSRGGLLNTGHGLTAAISAAPHPVSGEQKPASVQITGHLDEVDAPVWEFINAEARKLGPATGSIDTYNFTQPNGAQPNGVVAVLWNGMAIHALSVTVRDSMNRTQCVRLLADAPPAAQDVSGLIDVATGKIQHARNGMCPDLVEGFDVSDPECPACRVIAAHRAQAQGGDV